MIIVSGQEGQRFNIQEIQIYTLFGRKAGQLQEVVVIYFMSITSLQVQVIYNSTKSHSYLLYHSIYRNVQHIFIAFPITLHYYHDIHRNSIKEVN